MGSQGLISKRSLSLQRTMGNLGGFLQSQYGMDVFEILIQNASLRELLKNSIFFKKMVGSK